MPLFERVNVMKQKCCTAQEESGTAMHDMAWETHTPTRPHSRARRRQTMMQTFRATPMAV